MRHLHFCTGRTKTLINMLLIQADTSERFNELPKNEILPFYEELYSNAKIKICQSIRIKR